MLEVLLQDDGGGLGNGIKEMQNIKDVELPRRASMAPPPVPNSPVA